MCDFRNIIGVKFSDGYEISGGEKKHYPNFDELLKDNPENGIYHVGMTGCGVYAYREGTVYSEYRGECEFVVDGYDYGMVEFIWVKHGDNELVRGEDGIWREQL